MACRARAEGGAISGWTDGKHRRVLLLTPLLVAQGPAPDATPVIDQLLFARAMLCADCDNDPAREGVNRPARRSMIGADKLATARGMLDAITGLPGAAAARGHIARALAGLETLDEAAGITAIDAAIAALRR